jgi:putative ABC transport system permease protein
MKNLTTPLIIALQSLALKKVRTIASLFGIAFGVASLVTMLGIGEGVRLETAKAMERLGTNTIYVRSETAVSSPVSSLQLRDAFYVVSLASWAVNVAAVKDIGQQADMAERGFRPSVVAVSPELFTILGMVAAEGRLFTKSETERGQRCCVLGDGASRQLGGLEPGKYIRVGNEVFRVVGVLESAGRSSRSTTGGLASRNYDEAIIIPLPGAVLQRPVLTDQVARWGNTTISEFLVQGDGVLPVDEIARSVKRLLKQYRQDQTSFQIVNPLDLVRQKQQTERHLTQFLTVMTVVLLLIGAAGVMNGMLASIAERKVEIGVRRALGASRRDIFAQFVMESLVVSFVAGVAGALLGATSLFILSKVADMAWGNSASLLAFPVLVVLVTGFMAGVYPAMVAAAIDPIEALRGD